MSATRPVVKTETLEKKNQSSLGISLESGQLDRWYFHLGASHRVSVVNPFNGNFCELGRARFAEKRMEFPSHVVSKTYSILFSANFGPFSNPFRGRASAYVRGAVCSRNVLCSKT